MRDRHVLTLTFAALAVLEILSGCGAQPSAVLGLDVAVDRVAVDRVEGAMFAPELAGIPLATVPVALGRPQASLDVPNTCDRLVVVDAPAGPQLDKERPAWLGKAKTRTAHQREIREVIEAVGAELGVGQVAVEMIWRKAIYESSGNEGNVHVRTKDIEANRRAARKGRRRSSERWRRASIPMYRRGDRGLRKVGDFDAWALGRGLYGQVTGLHMHRWSDDAPPWSLCDPIIATVTVIWAMRAGLAECEGSTLRDAYRRFSSGKCAIRSDKLEQRFDRLARGHVRGLKLGRFDPDSRAELGSRWAEATADRGAMLAAVRARLAVP